MRLPGFGSVKNNDIVVFNYPDGDTVALKQQNQSYYQIVRDNVEYAMGQNKNMTYAQAYKTSWDYVNSQEDIFGSIVSRPVDKREHYVKRCVAIAGDNFSVINGEVHINNIKQEMPKNAQHRYVVKTKEALFGENGTGKDGQHTLSNYNLLDELDIYVSEAGKINGPNDTNYYDLNMPQATVERVKALAGVYSVTLKVEPKNYYDSRIFPHKPSYPWNNDNFGPLLIPKEGLTVPIDTHNICLYQKVLDTYDDGLHQVTKQGAQVLYDGKPITSYTFKQNYYFMMGDNRHNSADSRSWGLVPFDHIVGSPFFVWFSMKYAENNPVSGKSVLKSLTKNSKEGKFRWERFLCYVDDGNLHSIKIPFIIGVLCIWGFNKWNNRRKLKLEKEKK